MRMLRLTLFLPLAAVAPAHAQSASETHAQSASEAHAQSASEIHAQSAVETIESLHAALLESMRAGPEIGFDGRARLLAPILAATHDFPAMTRRALGAEAAKLAPEQARRLSDVLSRYTIATYASQFRAWDGERFEILGTAPAHGGGMLVPTRIVPVSGDAARLTYLLHETGEGWRIADVLLDGTISQVAVRRSEFQAIIRREGADGLLRQLERRIAMLASAPS